jgi:hypothetical protein
MSNGFTCLGIVLSGGILLAAVLKIQHLSLELVRYLVC